MSQKASYNFTFTTPYVLAGIIVADLEFDGRANFTFTPGEPEHGPSYSSGGEPATDPEIEIDSIEIYGHPDTGQATKGIYAVLSSSDPFYAKIEAWLLKECFQEMADAVDDPMADCADYLRDRQRDERLTDAPSIQHAAE